MQCNDQWKLFVHVKITLNEIRLDSGQQKHASSKDTLIIFHKVQQLIVIKVTACVAHF